MAYDSSTGIITAPVDMGDISTALGVDSLDLGTLCKSEAVNADALYRPYEIGRPNLEDALFKAGGDDGLYGYAIPMTENNTVIDLWGKTWTDNGRPTAYYHQLMFDGYCHGASYDNYPFRLTIQKVGSSWVVEYESHNDIAGQVNPGLMDVFKTYYPAFQVFAQGTPSTTPATTPIFNWCGSQQVGNGRSGEYLYDLNLEEGKTYYIIPFLSQYKFSNYAGNMGTLSGKKYCLIYKGWKITDWTISQDAVVVTKYDAWITLANQSSYTILATFGYRFYVDNLYIAPTYRYAVFNANGVQVYNQSSWQNVTTSFYGEVNTTYEFAVSISKVNPSTGEAWPSGYTIRVYHKEQTSASGSTNEFYEDYIIP